MSLVLAGCVMVPAIARAQPPQHLQDALTLAAQIRQKGDAGTFVDASNVPLNRYGGNWSAPDQSFVRFENLASGVLPANYTECAPLVTRILRHSYGWNWYSYVMRDIGLMTGHTAIVVGVDLGSGKTYPGDPLAKWAGTTYYELEVVDSSTGHHTADSKRFLDAQGQLVAETQGVGTGIMGVLVNADMEVVAHTWSLPSGDYSGSPDMQAEWLGSLNGKLRDQLAPGGREMVFGRLQLP